MGAGGGGGDPIPPPPPLPADPAGDAQSLREPVGDAGPPAPHPDISPPDPKPESGVSGYIRIRSTS